jgi:hypothetical protein
MADEQPPEPPTSKAHSRRARLALRRHRTRVIVVACLVVLVVAGAGTAVALRAYDADSAPFDNGKSAAGPGRATEPNLGPARDLEAPRPLSHEHPLKLWIGGDSLAGSFGPALGQTAGATGVVDATIDYKVSSGLADQGIRDWPEHATETMASEDPDAVVFIIGTNDASIASTYDGDGDGEPDWEKDYREKLDTMMRTFVGGDRHRTVFWLGPPTLGDSTLDRGADLLGPVMAQEARKFAPDVIYVDTYKLFESADGGYSRELPDATGEVVQMRISDGVHFTVDGAQYLGDIVWKLLDKRWRISQQAEPAQPIDYTIAEGSNDYVPGVGNYRPPVNDDNNDYTPDTAPVTGPPVTSPATTPATAGPTTPKTTPATTPHTTKPTSPPPPPSTVPHITIPTP